MTAPLTQSVASGVRAEISRQGLTQQQLADKAGIAQQTLSRRIRIKDPSPFDTDELERVAQALGVTAEQLISTSIRGGPVSGAA